MRYEGLIKGITYEDIAKASPLAFVVWIFDDFQVVDWNKSAERIFGWKREEVVGKNFFDFLIPKSAENKVGEVVKTIKAKKILTYSVNDNLTREGKVIECKWHNTPLKDKQGRINLVVSMAQDVTEMIQREEKLKESEEKFRSVVESTPNAIITVDEKGKIIYWNRAAEKIFGYSKDEIAGKPLTNIMPSQFRKAHKRGFKKASDRGPAHEAIEVPALKKDGTQIFVEWTLSSWRSKGKTFFTGIGKDITSKRKQEEKIKRLCSLQKIVREINEILLRIKEIKTESELFTKICETFVKEIEHFKFSWIGLVEKETFRVRPVAHAGFEEKYPYSVEIRWDESKYGMGPTGMAIKEKRPFIVNDIENDPGYSPWRKEALKRGYNSSAVFPLLHEREVVGILNIYSEKKDAFQGDEVEFLKEAALDIAIGIRSLRLEKELEKTVEELERTTEGIIWTIAKIVEAKDPYTSGHQRRVASLSRALAEEMNLPREQIKGVYMAATLHDIGKIYVPAEILTRPGRLTETEFGMIKTHPQYGYNMLKDVEFPWPLALAILQHHERLDGSGYPQGLSGEDIILEARILAVADVVEAMSSHRPYRPALGVDKALEEIETNKGKLYDPDVVDACVKLFMEKKFKFEHYLEDDPSC